MLYHASAQPGIRELVPQMSTHGREYVYAIKNRLTALLFGAPKDDFDILVDEVAGKTVIHECYPNALKEIYAGKSCSLYEVSADGFLAGQTGWDSELVCDHRVSVAAEDRIENLYEEILRAVQNGACVLHTYSRDAEYQDFLRDELSERIRSFRITDAQMNADPRFKLYFSELLAGQDRE